MHGNQFWRAWPLRFRSYGSFLLAFKTAKFSLRTMDYSPWSSKNLNDRNQPKKIMQAEVDITCMHTNFGEHGLSSFGDFAPYLLAFKMAKVSLQTMDYSPWGSKNRISSKNSCKQRLM